MRQHVVHVLLIAAVRTGASRCTHGAPDSHHSPCLTGVNALFIGDSTTRFEYLTLVDRLHKQTADTRHGAARHDNRSAAGVHASPPSPPRSPPAKEHAEYAWMPHGVLPTGAHNATNGCESSPPFHVSFYEESTSRFGDRMLCDCFRLAPSDPSADCCDQAVENRVYYGGSYRLSYLQWFGQYHMPRGNVPLHDALHALHRDALPARCPPGYGARSGWRWSYSVVDLLRHALSGAKVTHVIMNAGVWGTSNLSASFWQDLAAAGARLRTVHGTRVLWRTTVRPARQQGPVAARAMATKPAVTRPWSSKDDVPLEPFLSAGWEVYDANALVRRAARGLGLNRSSQVFSDGIHLWPKFNEVLVTHVLSAYLGTVVE